MKTLVLVRHAKSSWKNPDLTDRERPLNDRGKRDAPFMGKLLGEKGVTPDLIITSPANRAMSTARIIARELRYPADDIAVIESLYMGDTEEFLRILHDLNDSHGAVMIVGHNPEITIFTSFITGDHIDNMPTCGIVCADFAIDEWKAVSRGNGEMRFFEYPKKYFR